MIGLSLYIFAFSFLFEFVKRVRILLFPHFIIKYRTISVIRARSMNYIWIEEYRITRFHLQVRPRHRRVKVVNALICLSGFESRVSRKMIYYPTSARKFIEKKIVLWEIIRSIFVTFSFHFICFTCAEWVVFVRRIQRPRCMLGCTQEFKNKWEYIS